MNGIKGKILEHQPTEINFELHKNIYIKCILITENYKNVS